MESGEKVLYDSKTYDFGYYSRTPGLCVIYEEGELNMQDSIAVSISDVKPVEKLARGENK